MAVFAGFTTWTLNSVVQTIHDKCESNRTTIDAAAAAITIEPCSTVLLKLKIFQQENESKTTEQTKTKIVPSIFDIVRGWENATNYKTHGSAISSVYSRSITTQ